MKIFCSKVLTITLTPLLILAVFISVCLFLIPFETTTIIVGDDGDVQQIMRAFQGELLRTENINVDGLEHKSRAFVKIRATRLKMIMYQKSNKDIILGYEWQRPREARSSETLAAEQHILTKPWGKRNEAEMD